ncbi:MAG: GNAT family N-acetyltransferase [Pseudomonadota bacterium]
MTDIFTRATLTTQRLLLTPFATAHAADLNAIDNEPEVMQFLSKGTPKTLDETRERIDSVRKRWENHGYSWWTVSLRSTGHIIGAACAQHTANIPTAEIEIGWRLATAATGHGYATEAGLAAARYIFQNTNASHVIAVAHPDNINSHRVMQRIGMTYRGIETHYNEPCTTYVLHRSDLS